MRNAPARGFTLIELTVSVAVVGILLAAALLPLQNVLHNRHMEEAERMLEQAREALLAFVSEHGYFPCPAGDASGAQEAPGADHVTGVCGGGWHGFLPAAMIGFAPVDSRGFAVDPWGSNAGRLRYAVSSDTVGGVATPFTRIGGMVAAGLASIGAATNLLHVCGSGSGVVAGTNCGLAQTLASNAVVVVWSVGKNGGAGGGSSVHEQENPNPNSGSTDRIFVSRAHSTAAAAEFDDLVTWIPSVTIVTRLMAKPRSP